SAVKDEGTDLGEIEPALRPAAEAVGSDELVALPPLDARGSRGEPSPGEDERQAGAEVVRGRQGVGERIPERQLYRCFFAPLSERGHCAPTVAWPVAKVIPALRRIAGRNAGESKVVLAGLRSEARSATVST